MEYKLELASIGDIDSVLELYSERIKWFKDNSIKQWTNYLNNNPKSVFVEKIINKDYYIFKLDEICNHNLFYRELYSIINGKMVCLKENEILKSKLIGFDVIIDNKNVGKITEIFWAKANDVIRVNENILIPYVDEFIEKLDKENKKIYVKNVRGLL